MCSILYTMLLLEYEAKRILNEFSMPTPRSIVVGAGSVPFLPCVIKSQVPVGGRGKAGGVVVVHNQREYDEATAKISTLSIKGHVPNKLLAEEVLSIDKEFYIALRLNNAARRVEVVAHPDGGIDVEENDVNEFFVREISPATINQLADSIADLFEVPEKTHVVSQLLSNLYDCFMKNDALLIEINPLVLTHKGDLVAADCKMELDSAALFRHPEWKFETKPANANFVTLAQNGNVATIANGAGLAMATVDAVASAGLQPANFLDVGGGANEASVLAAFEEIMKYPNVQAIVINIFAGITRCDEVAKAIIAAKKHIPTLPPLCVRLAGTNLQEAEVLLEKENVELLTDLNGCIEKAKEHIS